MTVTQTARTTREDLRTRKYSVQIDGVTRTVPARTAIEAVAVAAETLHLDGVLFNDATIDDVVVKYLGRIT